MVEKENLVKLFDSDKGKTERIFPELIKKLVRNTISLGSSFRFPSGDNTWVQSFDGFVENNELNNSFIPCGNSVWEIGTNTNYNSKFNTDYKKRTEEKCDFDKSTYHFIFCTNRIWNGDILSAQDSKKADGVWKSVKIIDLMVIQDWLNDNLEVFLWLLNEFGQNIQNHSITLLPNEFRDITSSTTPCLNEKIMTCSNEVKSEDLHKLIISQKNNIITIFSPINSEHSYLFSIASLMKYDELSENVIVVKDQESLNWISTNSKDKIIVIKPNMMLNFENLKNNTFIASVNEKIYNPSVELNNIYFNDYEKALESMGIKAQESFDLAQKTNRNISCLKRTLANNPLFKKPLWANKDNSFEIIPLALITEINCAFSGDKEIIETLSGMKFDDYIQKLEKWILVEDSPVFKYDNIYRINSKEESLQVLNINYQSPASKSLESVIKEIFKVKNSHFDKPSEQWHIKNDRYKYSGNSIRGCLDSLAILSNEPGSQPHYDSFVKEIMLTLSTDKNLLHTFSKYFSILSEISSLEVINYINNCIETDDSIFKNFVETNYGFMFSTSSDLFDITSMLAKCLTRKDCATQSLKVLLKIYYKDYNSGLKKQIIEEIINHFAPITSLNMAINPADKLEILLSGSTKQNVDSTLNIMKNLRYNKVTHWFVSTGKPKWKKFEYAGVTYREMFEIDQSATNWIIENIEDKVRVAETILDHELVTIPFESLIKVLNKLLDFFSTGLEVVEKRIVSSLIKNTIRNFKRVYENNSKETEGYKSVLNVLDDLLKVCSISDSYEKYKHIFTSTPHDLYEFEDLEEDLNWQKYEQRKYEYVKDVIENLISEYGSSILKKLIFVVDDQNYIAQKQLFEVSSDPLLDMDSFLNNRKHMAFINYLGWYNHFDQKIIDLIDGIQDVELKKQIVQRLTIFLHNTNMANSIIKYIENNEYEAIFWKSYVYPKEHIDKIIFDKLLKFSPVNLLSWAYTRKETDIDNSIKILNSIIEKGDYDNQFNRKDNLNSTYYLSKLIEKLDKIYYSEELIYCEIMLLPILLSDYHTFRNDYPHGIKEYFWKNPIELFNLLQYAYNDANIKNLGNKSIISDIIINSIYILGYRTFIPVNYITDKEEEFKQWFYTILDLSKNQESSIKNKILTMLTALLAFCPEKKEQQIWPTKIVAELLELIPLEYTFSEDLLTTYNNNKLSIIASEFSAAKNNSRNGIARIVGDGSFELQEYSRYLNYSKSYQITNPTISLALDYVASSYKWHSDEDKKQSILGFH